MSNYSTHEVLNAIAAAQKALSDRKDEVNRLNVFPVPDGDTGTNMSLTMQMVVDNLAKLPIGASSAEIRKTITTGALMGARGNSGVITSQILRGLWLRDSKASKKRALPPRLSILASLARPKWRFRPCANRLRAPFLP